MSQLAVRFNELKPHVSVEAAQDALQETQKTLAEAASVK